MSSISCILSSGFAVGVALPPCWCCDDDVLWPNTVDEKRMSKAVKKDINECFIPIPKFCVSDAKNLVPQMFRPRNRNTEGQNVETKNQIRRASGLCGGEKEAEILVEEGAKEHKAKVRVKKAPSTIIGAGVIVALKSASGE